MFEINVAVQMTTKILWRNGDHGGVVGFALDAFIGSACIAIVLATDPRPPVALGASSVQHYRSLHIAVVALVLRFRVDI